MAPPNTVAVSSPLPTYYFGQAYGPAAAMPIVFQVSGHAQPDIATTFGPNPPSSLIAGTILPGPITDPLRIGGWQPPAIKPGGIALPPIQLNPGHIPGLPGGPPLPDGVGQIPIGRWFRQRLNDLGSGGSPLSYWRRQFASLRFGRTHLGG